MTRSFCKRCCNSLKKKGTCNSIVEKVQFLNSFRYTTFFSNIGNSATQHNKDQEYRGSKNSHKCEGTTEFLRQLALFK